MAEPYLGEIKMFASNFAPRGWALCNGQLLPIAQNQALFSLLGPTYVGNGPPNFALQDMRGRIHLHAGQGPVLSPRTQGEISGAEGITLLINQLPPQTHVLYGSSNAATPASGQSGSVVGNTGTTSLYSASAPSNPMAPGAIAASGGSQAHNNLAPYLCVTF